MRKMRIRLSSPCRKHNYRIASIDKIVTSGLKSLDSVNGKNEEAGISLTRRFVIYYIVPSGTYMEA